MSGLATGFGAGLVVLGVGAYFTSGQTSMTALIPAVFGVILIALGQFAKRDAYTKHAMHAAVVVALIGMAGSADGIPAAVRTLTGGTVTNPLAAWSKTLMALGLAVFFGFCVRSFRQARKARQQGPAPE